jgi:hypothetical protein
LVEERESAKERLERERRCGRLRFAVEPRAQPGDEARTVVE